ncbi:ATP-binding protein [Streptomyces sp. CC208A]|uniref:ATP-binding protein n=1 Tax=Streptomyces sp. CC208A TaxID=3044573 RepID=UPI0024A8E49D|nr:ATP-binding protein [Streptomyces sp. CC208A]
MPQESEMIATTTALRRVPAVPDAAAPVPRGAGVRERTAVCTMSAVPASVPALRRFARTSARLWDVPEDAEAALALVVTELVTNAVRHSGSPDVTLILATTADMLTVQVKDSGRWRSRQAAGVGSRHVIDDPACGGRGLRLVEEYADRCTLRRTAAGTRVMVELSLSPTPAAR